MLRLASVMGAAIVDVELKAAERFFSVKDDLDETVSRRLTEVFGETFPRARFLVSHHDYERTGSRGELLALVERARATGADAVKFVTTAHCASDALRVLHVLRDTVASGLPAIGLAMGEPGLPSRVLAGAAGGLLTFGTLDSAGGTAPGQPSLSDLCNVYDAKHVKPQSRVLGVVGDPVAHSRGPAIHNAALRVRFLRDVYVPFHVVDFDAFLREATSSGGLSIDGLSVTVPHKQAALAAASSVDAAARRAGAANTLVRERDGWSAHNTDVGAVVRAVKLGVARRSGALAADAPPSAADATSLKGTTLLVLGAGGAARALATGAVDAGARVIVANRTLSRAEEVARVANEGLAEPRAEAVSLEEVKAGRVRADVLANTTTIGMQPRIDESLLPAAEVAKFGVVFDAVYTPLRTKMLRDAEVRTLRAEGWRKTWRGEGGAERGAAGSGVGGRTEEREGGRNEGPRAGQGGADGGGFSLGGARAALLRAARGGRQEPLTPRSGT